MKYKILVNSGNSALLRDFFVNTTDFVCMSTSGFWSDLSAHYEMFQPDAYVCIAEYSDSQILSQIKRLKTDEKYFDVPVIMITNEDCFDFYYNENDAENIVDVILSRPITISAISERIIRLLHSIEEEKERIAKAKATEELEIQKSNAKKHIVIVDDDKNVLKLLKLALEDRYDVTAIVNGKMVLKLLETKTPDLIFLDYQLQLETGPEIFRKIKRIESARNIPIVFLTGIADREKITEVLSLKPQGYLLKPIDMDRVNETIKSLLG